MFGQNKIHGRKTFAGREDLLVTSIFYTLQGEGTFAGYPAVFVRLAHCNLACNFCDTHFSTGEWLTRQQITERMLSLTRSNGKDIHFRETVLVITGGEPSLQSHALKTLLLIASPYFAHVQIESNGLLAMDLDAMTYLVVSPKCAQIMGKWPGHYLKPPNDVLKRADALKFVLTSNADSPYHTIPEWAREWRRDTGRPLYISPMAEYLRPRRPDEDASYWTPGLLDLDKVRSNHEWAARYCLQHGYYLTMQMQLFASIP